MADYQKMYYVLCAAASKALDELPDILVNIKGRKTLQDALIEAENAYILEENTRP